MAVALILASDTEENVVVGGGAVARHIRAHRRAALQSAPVIMGSYYLAAWGGVSNLYLSRGRFAERAHPSAAESCFAFRQ